MKYLIYPCTLLLSSLVLYGCGHQCNCNQTVVRLSFIGYTQTEIDSIKIVKFQEGSQFGIPLDSILLTSANSYISNPTADTLDLYAATGANDFTIRSGYDWEIINLLDSNMTRLSEIQTTERTMHCGGLQLVLDDETCYSPIASFVANGVTIDPVTSAGVVRYYISK